MKIKEYDGNSPGFIGRERKRLAVIEAEAEWTKTSKLIDELAYFDALVDFLAVYIDMPIEKIEALSLNDLMKAYEIVLKKIIVKEGADPKDSEPTADGSEQG